MTDGNDPIVQTVYRQTGKDSYRPATEKEIKEGIYLVHKEGLTKREYFAAIAIQGILSFGGTETNQNPKDTTPQYIAEAAVIYANALIEELNKNENPNN